MKTEDISFLGRGWAFPPSFSPGGREVALVDGVQDVHQSLEVLLGTRLGERLMQEDYGCNLADFNFEMVNTTLVHRLHKIVEDAIFYFEPRIRLNDLTIDQTEATEGLLLIKLDYTLPASNSRYNLVYPYYINEN